MPITRAVFVDFNRGDLEFGLCIVSEVDLGMFRMFHGTWAPQKAVPTHEDKD